MHIETGQEITTLVNKDQLAPNRYYLGSIIDIVTFLSTSNLPFRGDHDSLECMSKSGSGLFLSLFEYTLQKDPELAKIAPTIPKNATYISHDIQNDIIDLMSKVVTEHIVEEIGHSFYTVTMDGTRDPTGCENISIVVHFVDENYVIKERLLTIATAVAGDAKTLTQTLIAEIRKVGLSTDTILSQGYDGASLMSGRRGGVQRLLQDELGREIPYVHCFNHQLHLVVVHAMSGERAIEDLFNICNVLYTFTRKPIVAAHYQGNTLKHLLEQRWTGHLATVQIILKSFQDIVELLRHVENSASFPADLRMEAAGLLSRILKPSFKFHTQIICKILSLLEPANRMMQSEEMDLQTAVQLVNTAKECVEALRTGKVFTEMWSECAQEREDDIHP
ncbi:hypothetical protein NHX12_025626, partial [Muraenolepis orangiensis]